MWCDAGGSRRSCHSNAAFGTVGIILMQLVSQLQLWESLYVSLTFRRSGFSCSGLILCSLTDGVLILFHTIKNLLSELVVSACMTRGQIRFQPVQSKSGQTNRLVVGAKIAHRVCNWRWCHFLCVWESDHNLLVFFFYSTGRHHQHQICTQRQQ